MMRLKHIFDCLINSKNRVDQCLGKVTVTLCLSDLAGVKD